MTRKEIESQIATLESQINSCHEQLRKLYGLRDGAPIVDIKTMTRAEAVALLDQAYAISTEADPVVGIVAKGK